MPSETFKRLPLEKQQLILDAAKKEFGSVSYHEASINKIIKDAGISRGSFYMYFNDKEDLYATITNHECEVMMENIFSYLVKNKGDLFQTYIDLYDFVYLHERERTESMLQRNVLLNMNFKSDHLLFQKMKKNHQKYVENFLNVIDTSRLKIDTNEELFDVVDMLNLLLIHSLVLTLVGHVEKSKIKERYERQINIIKHGVEKG